MSWCSGGDGDVWLFVGFLDQHVDEGLLFVLSLSRDDGSDWGRRRWGLDEDDFVMFLWDAATSDNLLTVFFRFWWGNVDVNVFLDYGSSSETTAESASESTAGRESSTG